VVEEKMKTTTKHDEWLSIKLKDADFAAEFLNAASQDGDPKIYLIALRKVVEARGGMAFIAEKGELSRETLYRTHQELHRKVLSRMSERAKAIEVDIDDI
jgi:probable addiction module antidote protein